MADTMSTAAERIRKLKASARGVPLVILVWGPGAPGATASPTMALLWAKRREIRSRLRVEFPHSEVFFSEDPELRRNVDDLPTVLAEELAEAWVSDCIIVLDVSRGAHVEVDHFSAIPEIAAKMHVFLPEEYVDRGLAREIHRRVASVNGFTDDDLRECNVLGRAIGLVMERAISRVIRPGI